MRKNIERVIQAFKNRESANGETCWTDGTTLYSYRMPIARWVEVAGGTHVNVIDVRESPSKTTTSQIRAVEKSFSRFNTVSSL